MAILFVAVYRPRQTIETYHWALYLEEGDTPWVYQVIGDPGTFRYNELPTRPENTDSHVKNIFVAEIDDVKGFRAVVSSQAIDNETYHWFRGVGISTS